MYSGKPPPLTAFANGAPPPNNKEAATKLCEAGQLTQPLQQQRPLTSENCDPNYPNLSVFGKEVLRKTAAEKSPPILDGKGSILQLIKPDGAGGVAAAHSESENAAAGELEMPSQQLKEVNGLPTPRKTSSLPSPTKATQPVSHQHSHGHGGRTPHFCRSPRCASNNPEYATPVQPPPRKYLISKRHLLPGAICTRDPAVLASQTQQDSSATPQAAQSTAGKPPKPSRNKLENVLCQPSFANVVSERNTPPLAYETSPTRIPKPPSARSPAAAPQARLHASIASSSPRDLSSAVSQIAAAPVATETRFSEPSSPEAEAQQQPVLKKSSEDDDMTQATLAGSNVGGLVYSSRLGSDTSCSVTVTASTSPRASYVGENSEAGISVSHSQLDSQVTSAGDESPSELSTSTEEKQISPTLMELPEEPSSDQRTPEPDGSVFAAISTTVSSSAELQDVTEKLAEKLAFKNVEDTTTPPQVGDCNDKEEMSSADVLNGRTESEEGSIPDHEPEDDEEQQFSNSENGLQSAAGNGAGADCEAEIHGDGEDYQFQNDMSAFDNPQSSEGTEEGQEEVPWRSIANYIEEFESVQNSKLTEEQREVPKYVRGKGRQLWRSDCRDSREVVFLKKAPQADPRGEDWMVDSILERAISKLNPSGEGRVRVLVEAFESLHMNLGGDPEMADRRASRVWYLNRMEKGELDEDGEEFEEGDQRVDCYEVSGDGLQLRASMRLSLGGGGNRLPLCNPDDADEIEMSAIQKVQEWDDDCRQSQSFEDMDSRSLRSQSHPGDGVAHDQENKNDVHSEGRRLAFGDLQRRISFSEGRMIEIDRSSEDLSCDARTESQFGCYTIAGVNQRTDARSTFSLDRGYKPNASRRRRYWKANPVNLVPAGPSSESGAEKDQRVIRGTVLEPFHLLTEERGMVKEYQFEKKLEQMFAEEERLRNPIAQGLPWTTDEPEVVPKPPVKEQTRSVEFRHYSNSRAIERAEFDNWMSERAVYLEIERQEKDRLRQLAEQEEIKRMRREMVPRAQLMPFFDQPFIPTRSSKRLTVPKEPTFFNRQHKRAKCHVWQQQQQQLQHQPWTYE